MGRELEGLDLSIVRGEQHITAAVAVEVGNEWRLEAAHVVLDRESLVRQVVPRLSEREVALVLLEEEGDGSARVPDRIGEGGGGGGLTWSEKKTVKAVRRRMLRSRFRSWRWRGAQATAHRRDLGEGGGKKAECTSGGHRWSTRERGGK